MCGLSQLRWTFVRWEIVIWKWFVGIGKRKQLIVRLHRFRFLWILHPRLMVRIAAGAVVEIVIGIIIEWIIEKELPILWSGLLKVWVWEFIVVLIVELFIRRDRIARVMVEDVGNGGFCEIRRLKDRIRYWGHLVTGWYVAGHWTTAMVRRGGIPTHSHRLVFASDVRRRIRMSRSDNRCGNRSRRQIVDSHVFPQRARMGVALFTAFDFTEIRFVILMNMHVLLPIGTVGESSVTAFEVALEGFLSWNQKKRKINPKVKSHETPKW